MVIPTLRCSPSGSPTWGLVPVNSGHAQQPCTVEAPIPTKFPPPKWPPLRADQEEQAGSSSSFAWKQSLFMPLGGAGCCVGMGKLGRHAGSSAGELNINCCEQSICLSIREESILDLICQHQWERKIKGGKEKNGCLREGKVKGRK